MESQDNKSSFIREVEYFFREDELKYYNGILPEGDIAVLLLPVMLHGRWR